VLSPNSDLSIVLFDEIEKAAPTVSQLLLGVLDKATLRLGDNTEVNFEKSLIFLTSNLGAREMMKELQPVLGFRPPAPEEAPDLTHKLEGIALNAVRRMYSPEFVNRIDVVDSEALALILDQQMADLQQHVNSRLANKCFNIEVTDESRAFLLEKGTSPEYGARELKRAIHRYLTQPLAMLVIENRIHPGSTMRVVLAANGEGLDFESTTSERLNPTAGPAVLIVDDNRDFLRLLSLEVTETTRWTVYTAQSVFEAETISASQKIDFALLDLLLPDGNGMDLGTRLVAQQDGIHIAIMTGAQLTKGEEEDCRKSKFDIVNKPFLPQQIISLVRERVMKAQKSGV
jgi:CheY-like chemotaxis protein